MGYRWQRAGERGRETDETSVLRQEEQGETGMGRRVADRHSEWRTVRDRTARTSVSGIGGGRPGGRADKADAGVDAPAKPRSSMDKDTQGRTPSRRHRDGLLPAPEAESPFRVVEPEAYPQRDRGPLLAQAGGAAGSVGGRRHVSACSRREEREAADIHVVSVLTRYGE